MNPRLADLVRKLTAGALSVVVTVLSFRVMFRAAAGRASLLDPELWVALALLVLGFAWVRAARRVYAAREEPSPAGPPAAGPPPPPPLPGPGGPAA